MAVNTIIGQAARGKNFFERSNITKDFWDKIKKGSNILITAPRRIGKTSLMFHFEDQPLENYELLYMIVESVNNENEYYRKLYNEVINLLKRRQKVWNQVTKLIKSKKVTSITKEGITLEDSELNYFEELVKIIKLVDLKNHKLVLMIDEFAQAVENIIEDETERDAVHFLETNRELRQLPYILDKIQLVYTGSIGLENIVSKINALNTINDLYPLKVPQLTNDESKELIGKITEASDLFIQQEQINYLISKIEWLIPYYFQIIIEELDKIELLAGESITNNIIDEAIDNALEIRPYFEHWFTRIRKAFKGTEFKFTKELLNKISGVNTFHSNEIHDMAIKFDIEDTYKDIINALKHDGYINNHDDPKLYRFNSPLLKKWWNKKIAN